MLSVLLTAGGRQFRQPARWTAPASIASEQLQVERLILEFRLQASNRKEHGERPWIANTLGVNTDVSATLEPLSIRVIVILNLGDGRPGLGAELVSARMRKALSPERAFAFAKCDCG